MLWSDTLVRQTRMYQLPVVYLCQLVLMTNSLPCLDIDGDHNPEIWSWLRLGSCVSGCLQFRVVLVWFTLYTTEICYLTTMYSSCLLSYNDRNVYESDVNEMVVAVVMATAGEVLLLICCVCYEVCLLPTSHENYHHKTLTLDERRRLWHPGRWQHPAVCRGRARRILILFHVAV